MASTTEKHGAERNRRMETEFFGRLEASIPGGELSIPAGSVTHSVSEKWCATCQRWVEVKGVLGALTFMAEHDHRAEAR